MNDPIGHLSTAIGASAVVVALLLATMVVPAEENPTPSITITQQTEPFGHVTIALEDADGDACVLTFKASDHSEYHLEVIQATCAFTFRE